MRTRASRMVAHSSALVALACAVLMSALPSDARAAVELQSVGPTFNRPVAVTGAPGDDQRLYVVEQRGTIQVVRDGVAQQFLDLTAAVRYDGEQGLLGLAFAPDFQSSRLLYVYFTDLDGDNRVEELRAPTGDAADPASRRLVLTVPHPGATNHNGGTVLFGPDGYLWLAPGDGDDGANARSLASLLGKILRIDPRGRAPGEYSIPPDNPFAGQDGLRPEIWAYGLRNPFRFTFDRLTGDLIVGDVGASTTEEIDHLPAASGRGRGADLGWDRCEGSFTRGSRVTGCATVLPDAVLPVIDRFRDEGFRSIIAGPVVRDPSLPSLRGRLVYGDYFVQALRTAVLDPGGGRATDDREVGPAAQVANLTSLGEDAAGCVYATSAAGEVYRLVELDRRIPCSLMPASPQPPAPGGDDSPPPSRAALRVKRRQRILRLGGVVVYVRCPAACQVAAGGKLHVRGQRRALQRVVRAGAAGRWVRLKPRLTRRARRALRRALARGGRPVAVVRVRVRTADSRRPPLLRRRIRAVG